MRTITLEIQNDRVVIKENNVEKSIEQTVVEMNEIKVGKLEARDVEELLKEIK